MNALYVPVERNEVVTDMIKLEEYRGKLDSK
jgi:hypothetical protein